MKLKIESYSALCALRKFSINNINADMDDFVDQYDHAPHLAEDYACGDMRADIKPTSEDVLTKYGITINEYNEIAEKVAEKVSFGCCGWCV